MSLEVPLWGEGCLVGRRELHKRSDSVLEEQLAEHLPFIQAIAHKIAIKLPITIEIGDLIGAGVLGCWDAKQRYDASLGVPFRAYAELRIRGAMLDTLRELDWASRSLRRRLSSLASKEKSLQRELGRAPSDEELASGLGVGCSTVERIRACRAIRVFYLEDLQTETSSWQDSSVSLSELPSVLEQLCQQSDYHEIHQAIQRLSERERFVVQKSFFENVTLRDIGEQLGVTESRACQIRGQALQKLEKRIRFQQNPTRIGHYASM